MLRGRGTLLRGEERVAVETGDVAAFPAGTGVAHAFVADLGEELEYFSIGERKDNEVVLYPDSGKMLVDESRVHTQIVLTPLLTPLRAQHTDTMGNHQQRNRLRQADSAMDGNAWLQGSADCGSGGRGFESRRSPSHLQVKREARLFNRASFTTTVLQPASGQRQRYCTANSQVSGAFTITSTK